MTIITLWHCKEPVLLAKNHNQEKTKLDNWTIGQLDKCPFGGIHVFRCLISYIIYIL